MKKTKQIKQEIREAKENYNNNLINIRNSYIAPHELFIISINFNF